MGDLRAEQAIDRIERALARIESAASGLQETAATAPGADERRLREKHEALRGSVRDALHRLEALLPAQERG